MGKVISLKGHAAGRDVNVQPPASQTVSITGTGNAGIVGSHNQVNINVRVPGKAVQVRVQPGPDAVTPAQAAEIQELVAKVVRITGKPYEFVWPTLKRKFRFTSYLLLPAIQFEEVRAYLRKWIASSDRSAGRNPVLDRKKLLGRIHAEAKKVPGMIDQIHAYIHGRFGTLSLGDLAPGQLVEVVREFNL